MKKLKCILSFVLVSVILVTLVGCNGSDGKLKVGTAEKGGIYNTLGKELVDIAQENNIKLKTKQTEGSVANLNLLSGGYIDFGFTQANYLSENYSGDDNIKLVAGLYSEACHIVVRKDSDINTVDDLSGKTVSIGEVGSGTEESAKQILSVYGLSDGLLSMVNYTSSEASSLLNEQKIDAFFYMIGIDNNIIENLLQDNSIKLIGIEKKYRDRLIKLHNSYSEYTISKNTYKGQSEDISTVGIRTFLVAKSSVSDDVVYSLTKLLYEQKENLIERSQLGRLPFGDLYQKDNITIPFHSGAKKYYNEIGINVE